MPMKPTIQWIALSAALGLCGCAQVREPASGLKDRGSLAIRVTSLNGMKGDQREARIYVDGRFVGNYEPDETLLPLAAGGHRVRLELPEVHELRRLPNGEEQDRAYTLGGEERVEILGGGTKQVVSFGAQNLVAREVRVPRGR